MQYPTEKIFQRPIVQNNASIAAGTYKAGQLLGRVDATGVYGAYNSGDTSGLETVRAAALNDVVIPSGGGYSAIAKGECDKDGIVAVMASLTSPVTVDAVLIGQCFDAGIILN